MSRKRKKTGFLLRLDFAWKAYKFLRIGSALAAFSTVFAIAFWEVLNCGDLYTVVAAIHGPLQIVLRFHAFWGQGWLENKLHTMEPKDPAARSHSKTSATLPVQILAPSDPAARSHCPACLNCRASATTLIQFLEPQWPAQVPEPQRQRPLNCNARSNSRPSATTPMKTLATTPVKLLEH